MKHDAETWTGEMDSGLPSPAEACPSCAALLTDLEALRQERDDLVVFNANGQSEAALATLRAELAELRDRDRVISQQLERRANGQDALTQSLIAENDRLYAEAKALSTLRAAVQQIEQAGRVLVDNAVGQPDDPLWIVSQEAVGGLADALARLQGEQKDQE